MVNSAALLVGSVAKVARRRARLIAKPMIRVRSAHLVTTVSQAP